MAVLFLDGFDDYDTSTLAQNWTLTGAPTITATNARTGTCLSIGSGTQAELNLGTSWLTIFVGVAVRAASFVGTMDFISYVYDSTIQTHVVIAADGSLKVYRGTGTGNLLGSGALTGGWAGFQINTWHYVEIGISMYTAGNVHINVDGVRRCTLTGVNTKAVTTGGTNRIRLHTTTGLTCLFDDLYVCNQGGPAPHNTFLGVGRIETLLPSSDGASTDWTPSTGSDHYAVVDEAVPNGDTDYISGASDGLRDSFNFASLSAPTQQVIAVAARASCKQDSGAHTIKLQTRPSPTSQTFDGSARALTSSYGLFTQPWGVNPATGGPWTVAEVNSAQFGIKLHSTSGTGGGGVGA